LVVTHIAPFCNRFGFNDDQALQPIFPQPRQHYPEELIPPVKLRPFDTSIENGKFLAKPEDFCRECQSRRHHRAGKLKQRRADEHRIGMNITELEAAMRSS
jgi:hypothetical protein